MKEQTNEVDKHAVAVVCINSLSKEVVFGYVPKFISMFASMFLPLPECTLSSRHAHYKVDRGKVDKAT